MVVIKVCIRDLKLFLYLVLCLVESHRVDREVERAIFRCASLPLVEAMQETSRNNERVRSREQETLAAT